MSGDDDPPTLFDLLPEDQARRLYRKILAVTRDTTADDPEVEAEVDRIIQQQKDLGVR